MNLSAKMQSTLIHMCECTGTASELRAFWSHRTFYALVNRGLVVENGRFGYRVTSKGREVYRELKG